MASESSKAHDRRVREGVFDRLLVGRGIDIGCGDDPVTPDCDRWDYQLGHGDAMRMEGVPDESYSWVSASHVLEHCTDPEMAISRWWQILRHGGVLLVTVPDSYLYEKHHHPSRFNSDHKYVFTVDQDSPPLGIRSINCTELVKLLRNRNTLWIRRIDSGYDYTLADDIDQTRIGAECNIEICVQKV